MPLESTVVCIDNSEFMRNGDFSPNRLEAERDAANMIISTKLRDNPENSCAVLSMGAKIDVLSTLTADKSKLFHCLHEINASGTCNFVSGIMVAQLILRHRESKNHKQRVVTFVGSPVTATEKELVQLGKKLKKSNVNVDIISFGEEDANQPKLEAFINAVNRENGSHLVVVPSGSGTLSNSIMASPMLGTNNASQPGNQGGFGGFDGMDDADPELAMALRMSLEEERQRLQRAQQASAEGDQQQEGEADNTGDQMNTAADDDDELAAALLMSTQDNPDGGDSSPQPEETTPVAEPVAPAQSEPNFAAMTEEEMLQYALQLSMQDQPSSSSDMDSTPDEGDAKPSKPEESSSSSSAQIAEPSEPAEPPKDEIAEEAGDVFQDPEFLASVLEDLPGVNKDDAGLQEMLASLQGDAAPEQSKEEEGDKNEESGDGSSKDNDGVDG